MNVVERSEVMQKSLEQNTKYQENLRQQEEQERKSLHEGVCLFFCSLKCFFLLLYRTETKGRRKIETRRRFIQNFRYISTRFVDRK
jgi:hypothetical protein